MVNIFLLRTLTPLGWTIKRKMNLYTIKASRLFHHCTVAYIFI